MIRGIGIDAVETARFAKYKKASADGFLGKIFTGREQEYCFGHKEPKNHLAGTFAAKEAVSKALDATKIPFPSIEIRRSTTGQPSAWFKRKKLKIALSITHTDTIAFAVAVLN